MALSSLTAGAQYMVGAGIRETLDKFLQLISDDPTRQSLKASLEINDETLDELLRVLQEACVTAKATKRVIVTHHVPSFQLSSPDFKGSRTNGAFVSDEDVFIENCGADYWIYVHSHRNIENRIGETMCVSNQLGYVFSGEHQRFNPGRYLEVGG